MKRLLVVMLFVLITACQAQEQMSYPDTFISYIANQDNSPSIVLRTSSDRQCFISDCPAHVVLIHKEAQRVVLEADARGVTWMQVSKDGQRLGLYYLRGRVGRSADDVQTIVEIRSMEDGRVLFSHEYESTGLEAGFESNVRPLFVFSEDLNFVVRQTYIDTLREISVWDTRTNELIYSRECEYGMFGMFDTELISPDGKHLLFGCADEEEAESTGVSGQMQLIELETGEVLHEIDRYHWSGAVKWDDTSSYFMVTGNGKVRFFTLEGELTEVAVTGFSALSDFSPDSRFFFVHESESLTIVNLEEGTSTRILASSIRSRSLGRPYVSPDLSHVVIDGETNQFAVIRLDTGEIEAQHGLSSAEFGYNQFGETWHPDGRYAAFCGDTSFVFLWESASDEMLSLPSATGSRGAGYCQLAFSSDGRYLAYERHLTATEETEYSVSIEVYDLETMESIFQTEYLFGEAVLTVLEWQTGRNRLFVTNPAESQIEVFEFP